MAEMFKYHKDEEDEDRDEDDEEVVPEIWLKWKKIMSEINEDDKDDTYFFVQKCWDKPNHTMYIDEMGVRDRISETEDESLTKSKFAETNLPTDLGEDSTLCVATLSQPQEQCLIAKGWQKKRNLNQ